jgi:hypothetical protein
MKLSPQEKYAIKLMDEPEEYPCLMAPCFFIAGWECSTCPLIFSNATGLNAFIEKYHPDNKVIRKDAK